MTDTTADVLARHERIPARAGAAARVLQLADDPDTSAQDLARAIGTDPLFAAKILRIGNSTFYGLSGRVSTLPFAVSVVGFQTVRSLAVVAAAGLDDPDGAPEGFWRAAALCATGCELTAPLLGADPGDAFSVGLLHTLGAALLHQDAPPLPLCLPSAEDDEGFLLAEQERFGITHDALGAQVLAAWQFPRHICSVIGRHHQPLLPDAGPLERTLQVARGLADALLREDGDALTTDGELAWLSQGRINVPNVPALLEQIHERSETLLDGLQTRR